MTHAEAWRKIQAAIGDCPACGDAPTCEAHSAEVCAIIKEYLFPVPAEDKGVVQ